MLESTDTSIENNEVERMQWLESGWFRHVSGVIALLFLFSCLQPTTLGYVPVIASSQSHQSHSYLSDKLGQILSFLIPAANAQTNQDLLRSTPDADINDPFIIEKAAELGNDPVRIFEFVRDEIGFESYVGSLRGARGTLWSKAGNALDQASLLIALLRVSGVPARYVKGTLADEDAKILIASMFDPELMAQAIGFVPDRFERTDPVNDPNLLAEVRDHWWAELQDGTPLDPSFAAAAIGNASGVQTATHAEAPDAERHHVTVRLKAEFNNPLGGFIEKIPLEQTFATVEIYGKPLAIGHFVDVTEKTSLLGFGETTFIYSPYLQIEDNDTSIDNNELIRGEDYQEFFSSAFPLANRILTRLTLEMEIQTPGEPLDVRRRDLLDRIGFAARNGLAQPGPVSGDQPALTFFDLTTVYITPGFITKDLFPPLQEALRNLSTEAELLQPQAEALAAQDPATLTAADQALLGRFNELNRAMAVAGGSIIAAGHLLVSDSFVRREQATQLTRAYYNTPRLTLYQAQTDISDDSARLRLSLDLRRNHIRAVPYPGQNALNRFGFNMIKGRWDSVIEHEILELLLPNAIGQTSGIVSPISVLQAADAQGVPVVALINEGDIPVRLEGLAISAEAKARIAAALRSGQQVNVPARRIAVNGQPAIGWWEIDANTGEVISVSEDGGRNALAEYLNPFRKKSILTEGIIIFVLNGLLLTVTKLFWDQILDSFAENMPLLDTQQLFDLLDSPDSELENSIEATNGLVADPRVFTDPSISPDSLSVVNPPGTAILAVSVEGSIIDFMGTNNEVLSLFALPPGEFSAPGGTVLTGPGLVLEVVPERDFVVKAGEGQLPSGFRVRITNTGDNGQFTLEGTAPPEWNLLISKQEIPIPEGVSGQASVFLQPRGDSSLFAPGTAVPFTITVARSDDPAVRLTQNLTFVVPEISGLTMEASPEILYVTPNGSVQTRLAFTNAGNVPAPVNLALDTPSGFTATGLDSGLSLAPGELASRTLTLTVPDLPLNSDHFVRVIATFVSSAEPAREINLRIRIVDPVALTTLDAANAADGVGRLELGDTLELLGQALTDLAQDPSNEILQSRVTALLDSLIAQLNAPALTPFIASITAARNAIASGSDIPGALGNLSNVFEDLNNSLRTDPEALPFELALLPNSRTALPNTPTEFNVFLKNNRPQATTFNLSLSDLPSGVVGELNQTSVTLAPGEATSVEGGPQVFATLTQSAQELIAFDFSVTASIAGTPGISRTAQGAFTVRDELIKVVDVDADPRFTGPGGQVNVSTRLLNAVNRDFPVLVSFTVKDPAGTAVFASTPQEVELTVLSTLDTVDLGILDTSGFSLGDHTLEVMVTDLNGVPIPGATGQGNLFIGTPVTASMSVEPQVLPPGDGIVTTSLRIDNRIANLDQDISLLGLIDTQAEARSAAIQGNLAYVCGNENVTIVDVSDPRNPAIVRTFADDLLSESLPIMFCRIFDNHLFIFSQRAINALQLDIFVYSLENPTQPQLVTDTSVNRRFISGVFSQADHAYISTSTVSFIPNPNTNNGSFIGTAGDFFSLNLSDIANPQLSDVLIDQPFGPPDGGQFPIGEAAPVNERIALVPTTSCIFSAINCSGRVLVVDISDPNNLAILADRPIPQTALLTSVVIQGNMALAIGSSGVIPSTVDLDDPFKTTGNLTLTILDITEPLNPEILATETSNIPMASLRSLGTSLGNGFFAVSSNAVDNTPVLILVDANDLRNPELSTFEVPAKLNELTAVGTTLYTTSSAGLGIYDLGGAFGTRITAQVQVPKNSIIAGSQNLALRPGVTADASSFWTAPPGFVPERAIDGNPNTSWFSANGDTVSQGTIPFFEIFLPGAVTVSELRILGNREFAAGDIFDALAGVFELFDAAGNVLFESSEITAQPPDEDMALAVPDIAGVRRVRFTVTADGGSRAGFAELQVIGHSDDPSANPFAKAFNRAPTEIILGDQFDTVVWEQSLSELVNRLDFTWRSAVTDLQPGEAREVTLGTTIDFTIPSGDSGQIELPPLLVISEQILALTPASRTVDVGDPASYTLTIKNPTDSPVTYTLSVLGIPQAWVNLVPSVTVPGQGSVNQALTLRADAQATPGENGFVVSADTDSGARAFVNGTLTLEGIPGDGGGPIDVGEDVESVARGIVAALTTLRPVAGQGTDATLRLRLTNTGNVTDTVNLSADLPAGFTGAFGQTTVEVPPGLDNFREVLLTVTPSPGTVPGAFPITVTATSNTDPSVSDRASATVTVAAGGVNVAISPTTGNPATAFQVSVTNTGQAEETFDLTAGGPLGPFAALGMEAVTLGPGASQTIMITLDEIDFSLPGSLDLIAVATSRSNAAVQNIAIAEVVIPATQGVEAEFNPDAVALGEPGTTQSLLVVRNTGNTEDAYGAEIAGTTGPVTGSLTGLDGQPTNEVPLFRLPGLSTGAILLNAELADFGSGNVIARVSSLSDAAVTDTATLNIGTGNEIPDADAGPDQTVPLGNAVLLNGEASRDPDNGPQPLSFEWRLVAKPGQSALALGDADIGGARTALATLTPDVSGEYVVELRVSDGLDADSDEVVIRVENNPPVADAGPDQNVKTGTEVRLDGSGSFDPDGQLIGYGWSIEWDPNAKPAGSALGDADIAGRTTPDPSFTPDVDGDYEFRLIVQDEEAASSPDFVTISATSGNVPPNARAGADLNAQVGDLVILNGSASHDPDGRTELLTHQWTLESLPDGSGLSSGDIVDATQSRASFTPDVPGLYEFNLHVGDGQAGDDDRVVITVSLPNVPPNAEAGVDQEVVLGNEAVLDGTASRDPDGAPGPLNFIWRFVFLPAGSALNDADLADADSATPRFIPDVAGSYVLRLEVSDSEAKDADNVLIKAIAAAGPCDGSPFPEGDIDQDCDVDRDDVNLVLVARNTPATGPDDPRDLDGDGIISANDARRVVTLCTRSRCNTQ